MKILQRDWFFHVRLKIKNGKFFKNFKIYMKILLDKDLAWNHKKNVISKWTKLQNLNKSVGNILIIHNIKELSELLLDGY